MTPEHSDAPVRETGARQGKARQPLDISEPQAALAVNPDAYDGKGPFEIGQVRAAVRHYLKRGWVSTPCIPSTKRPRLSKWEKRGLKAEEIDTIFNEADPDRNKEGDSIGLVLGQMSDGLVVVDLDHVDPEIAAFLLPESALVDGREGNPTSHWFYRVPEELRKQTFTHPDRDKGKIIELLGDGEQVIVPPSTHPSGVHRVWEKYGEPSEQDAPELVEVCARIAAYQVIADLWPGAGRHDLALPLAGGLLRAGIDDGEVEWFLNYLCKSTVKDHREIEHIVQSTAQKLEEGDARVSGWPMFAAMLGGGSLQRCLDAVLGWLNVADVDLTDPRPRVPVFGTSHSTAKRVWPVVEEANDPPVLFRRGKRFLRTRPHDDSGGVTGVTAEELDYNSFKFQLSEVVCLTKQDDKGKHRAVDPPKGIVDDMLANPNPPVPVLNRIVSVPVFAPDGTLQVEPGYHSAARVYYQPAPGLDVPTVPLSPTDEDIQQARELLLELLQDFPFVDEADRTHAVALALLPFARDLINGPTPWHMISASREGTGKGLLAQVLSMIFEGGNGASGQPMSQSEEEMRKTILSSLMQSSTFILWDNISGLVDSASLAAALTAIDYMDRKLGVSEMVPIRVRSVWIGTANNPAMSGEITRRSIRIRIEAKEQRPDERKDYLHPNLAQWVGENRSRLVGACLTLVQAWVAAGKPTGDYTMGSYADWAGVMGGILDTAGLSGLLDNVQEFRSEAHGQGTAWESFTEGWWDEFGPHPKTAGELLQRAREADVELPLTTQEHPAQKLGYLLSGQIGNVWGDYVIRLGAKRRGKGKSYMLVSRSGAKWEKSERPTGDQPQAFDGQRGSAAR
jgi:hypothetical protein